MFGVTIVTRSFLYRVPTEKGKAGKRSSRPSRGTSVEAPELTKVFLNTGERP